VVFGISIFFGSRSAFLDGIRDKYTALYHAMELDETRTLAECIDHVLRSAKRMELNAVFILETCFTQHSELHRYKAKYKLNERSGDRTFAAVATSCPSLETKLHIWICSLCEWPRNC
jgi:hypothetical protein